MAIVDMERWAVERLARQLIPIFEQRSTITMMVADLDDVKRWREQNLACVACEPADDGHRHLPTPSAHDVLASALGRSGNEQSAAEAFRFALGRSEDPGTLRAILAEALRQVDALAGRDRAREIELLQKKHWRSRLGSRWACGGSEADGRGGCPASTLRLARWPPRGGRVRP